MDFKYPMEIESVLRRYRKDFESMDTAQIKDVAMSLDGLLTDMRHHGWDYDKMVRGLILGWAFDVDA